MAMASKTTTTTDVEIFGTVYHVRGEDNPEHLQEVANMVDQRMREVAQQVTTVDTAKIAILAALNIADEMYRRSKQQDGERVEIQERVATLTEKLEKALGS
jgi:cell division protein ZapA